MTISKRIHSGLPLTDGRTELTSQLGMQFSQGVELRLMTHSFSNIQRGVIIILVVVTIHELFIDFDWLHDGC